MDKWKPIETCPINRPVLFWWRPIDSNKYAECSVIGELPFERKSVWWNNQRGEYQDRCHVTHWMDLPKPPEKTPEQKQVDAVKKTLKNRIVS